MTTDHMVEYECSWIDFLGLEKQALVTPVKEDFNTCNTRNNYYGNADNINKFEEKRINTHIHDGEERPFYDCNPFSLIIRPLYAIPEEVSICIDDEELASENHSYSSNMSNTRKGTKCCYDDLVGLSVDADDDSWHEERTLTKNAEQCTPDNWGQFATNDDGIFKECLPVEFVMNLEEFF